VVERQELHDWIEAAIRTLPADQRIVVALADIHGYAYEEIADMLDVPMGTVKSRLSRARTRLRDYLLRKPELLPGSFRPRGG
jgi:RNA polymerase sigma-70 factor (ECF subfamily)